MAKNRHPKKEIARKLLSNRERSLGTQPFNGMGWVRRSVAIAQRVKRNIDPKYRFERSLQRSKRRSKREKIRAKATA